MNRFLVLSKPKPKKDDGSMGNYFKPLRRKFGVLTLVLACVLLAGWLRSVSLAESWMMAGCGRQLIVVSACQKFLILIVGDLAIGVESDFQMKDREFHSNNLLRASGDPPSHHHFVATSARASSAQTQCRFENGMISSPITMIPYWSIVLPLTLISAWLLLSQPKRQKSIAPEQSA